MEQEIIVCHDAVAQFWHPQSQWFATVGDFDLDCIVGTGLTPLDAIVDLLDQLEG